MHESYELASQVIHVHAGGLFLPETPNSLVERGYLSEAKSVLQKVRGTKDVDVEFDTIVLANEALKGMESPWKAIFRRRNRPQLILAIAMPFFQYGCSPPPTPPQWPFCDTVATLVHHLYVLWLHVLMLLCQVQLPTGICCGKSMAKLMSTVSPYVALSVCKQFQRKSGHCKRPPFIQQRKPISSIH